MKIAIINNNPKSFASNQFEKAILAFGAECIFLNPAKSSMILNTKAGRYNKINCDEKLIGTGQIDLFLPRITQISKYNHVLYHLSEVLGIYSPVSVNGLLIASDKMRTLQRASMAGIRVPKTILISEFKKIGFALDQVGVPCIIKTIYGSKGVGVAKADSYASAQSTIQSLLKLSSPLIIEEFIPTGNKDIRAIVVDKKVVAAMERVANEGDFRANLSQGGFGKPYKLNEELENFCVNAAKSLPLEIAGVDIIFDRNNKPILLEVNGNPGFGIQRVTGIDIAKEIIAHSIKKYKSKLKSEPQESIAFSLPDDVYLRTCYLKAKGKSIGFTNREGIKQVIAINTPQDFQYVVNSSFKMNQK